MDFKKMSAGAAFGKILYTVGKWFATAALIWWAGTFLPGTLICRSSSTWKSLPCVWL